MEVLIRVIVLFHCVLIWFVRFSNYRPISPLKIFLLNLYKFSAEFAALYFSDHLTRQLVMGKILLNIYLDLNTIKHLFGLRVIILLYKLDQYVINGVVNSLIGRKQYFSDTDTWQSMSPKVLFLVRYLYKFILIEQDISCWLRSNKLSLNVSKTNYHIDHDIDIMNCWCH